MTFRRVAPWFSRQLAPLIAGSALVANTIFGLVLFFAPRGEFRSHVWDMAREVWDLQTWGVLLLTLTAMAALIWWVQGRCRLASFVFTYLLGSGFWGFWTILTAWSSFGPNGTTGAMAVLSAFIGTAHVLAGLAWPAVCPPVRK